MYAGLVWLAPGTFYPPHAHDALEMYHVISGQGFTQNLPKVFSSELMFHSCTRHSQVGAHPRVPAAQKTRRDIRPPAGAGAHDDGAGG